MTLRISTAFAKQFKCSLGTEITAMQQGRQLNSWSCHFIRLRRKPVILVMNDATLYIFLIPATGVKTIPQAWSLIRSRIFELWDKHGVAFTSHDETPFFLARNNRSLIGYMNEIAAMLNHYNTRDDATKLQINLKELEQRANSTPYKALNYDSALENTTRVLGEIQN